MTDESWRDQALCAETDPEAFFPDKGGDPNIAKRLCAGCSVAMECLTFALSRPEGQYGVWGGTTAKERHAMYGKRTA